MKALPLLLVLLLGMPGYCLAETTWTEDLDGDGRAETRFTDSDDDGNPDASSVDRDGDGVYEEYWRDVDDDGDWDRNWFDDDADGEFDRGYQDTDDDGDFDQQWDDTNGNNRVDPGERTPLRPEVPVNGPRPVLPPGERGECGCGVDVLEPDLIVGVTSMFRLIVASSLGLLAGVVLTLIFFALRRKSKRDGRT